MHAKSKNSKYLESYHDRSTPNSKCLQLPGMPKGFGRLTNNTLYAPGTRANQSLHGGKASRPNGSCTNWTRSRWIIELVTAVKRGGAVYITRRGATHGTRAHAVSRIRRTSSWRALGLVFSERSDRLTSFNVSLRSPSLSPHEASDPVFLPKGVFCHLGRGLSGVTPVCVVISIGIERDLLFQGGVSRESHLSGLCFQVESGVGFCHLGRGLWSHTCVCCDLKWNWEELVISGWGL